MRVMSCARRGADASEFREGARSGGRHARAHVAAFEGPGGAARQEAEGLGRECGCEGAACVIMSCAHIHQVVHDSFECACASGVGAAALP